MKYTDIVFDGPPSHDPPCFVEVEDENGKSIRFGEWVQRPDGYWALRVQQEVVSNNENVRAFHEKFGVPMSPAPALLDHQAEEFRSGFMQEELNEFRQAHANGDLIEAADALIDLAYVVHGTALMMGLPWDQLWAEVQRANMEKVRASSAVESKRGSQLDVVKPPGWQPPNHFEALKAAPLRVHPKTHKVGFATFNTKTGEFEP